MADHIEQIRKGTKTQTRRLRGTEWYPRYKVGQTYKITPGRGKPAISDGVILMLRSWVEYKGTMISEADARAEGGYGPEEYEALFRRMYPNWQARWAYEFRFITP